MFTNLLYTGWIVVFFTETGLKSLDLWSMIAYSLHYRVLY